MTTAHSTVSLPDASGHFGPYGGVFVPETLVFALTQLEREYRKAQQDPEFKREFEYYLREFVGPPAATTSPAASLKSSAARRSTSSAKTSTTPAPTRSTTRSARLCSRCAWVRSA
jgi:hypothetical protein